MEKWIANPDGWGGSNKNLGGNVELIVNSNVRGISENDSDIETIYGAGEYDVVSGLVKVTLNGGRGFEKVYLGGRGRYYDGNNAKSEILNWNQEQTAASLTINGGDWQMIYGSAFHATDSAKDGWEQAIKGNVLTTLNDGKVETYCLTTQNSHVYGNHVLEIYGGTFGTKKLNDILGTHAKDRHANNYKSGQVDGKREVAFLNKTPVKLYDIVNIDPVIVDNTMPAIISGYDFGSKNDYYPPLDNCGSLDIKQDGQLYFGGTCELKKDLNVDGFGVGS